MRTLGIKRAVTALAAIAVLGAGGAAFAQATSAADAVHHRQEQLRRLGAAFKDVNDQVRSSHADVAVIRANAQTISQLAADFPNWFPAGSGPESGVEMRAKAEVWSNRATFDTQTRAFQAAAQAFATASAGTDMTLIAARARALGAACSSCHADFRNRS